MTTSSVFLNSDYFLKIWYSHPYVLKSELTQSKKTLFTAENPMFQC